MRLYYTTTAKQDGLQQKPSQSLGGFKSKNPVPNTSFGSLFSDVSLLTLEKNLPEYIGLMLVNERGVKVENIKIWLESSLNNLCKYKVSVIELNSINQSEMLPSINSRPLYASFYEAGSEEEGINIPAMEPNEIYGIWLERSLNTESEIYKNFNNCEYLATHPSVSLSEEIELKINFSDVIS